MQHNFHNGYILVAMMKMVCPWCDHDVLSPYVMSSLKVFRSGSREAKRALRSGRAKVFSRPGSILSHVTVDKVVCAHPCHEDRLSRIRLLESFD